MDKQRKTSNLINIIDYDEDGNILLGENGISGGFFKFDTTPTDIPEEQGAMFWDEDDNTVDVILNGYRMKIGEDLFYPVKNQTGTTIPKGTNVRFAGTVGASARLLIAPFIANNTVPSTFYMGVTAETIADGEDGKVLWFGRIRGINTNAFNEGDVLYASTTVAGGFQTTIPTAPNNIIQVAAVINKSTTQGVIFTRPQIEPVLYTPENVANKVTDFTSPSDITYPTSLAVNTKLGQKEDSLGFTPENVANKATTLTSPDNTKYPTTQAVVDALASFFKETRLAYNIYSTTLATVGDSSTLFFAAGTAVFGLPRKVTYTSTTGTQTIGVRLNGPPFNNQTGVYNATYYKFKLNDHTNTQYFLCGNGGGSGAFVSNFVTNSVGVGFSKLSGHTNFIIRGVGVSDIDTLIPISNSDISVSIVRNSNVYRVIVNDITNNNIFQTDLTITFASQGVGSEQICCNNGTSGVAISIDIHTIFNREKLY